MHEDLYRQFSFCVANSNNEVGMRGMLINGRSWVILVAIDIVGVFDR